MNTRSEQRSGQKRDPPQFPLHSHSGRSEESVVAWQHRKCRSLASLGMTSIWESKQVVVMTNCFSRRSLKKRALTQLFHHLLQHFPSRARYRLRQRSQRFLSDVEHIDKARRLGVYIEKSSQDFAFFVGFVQAADGFDSIRGIVIFFQ